MGVQASRVQSDHEPHRRYHDWDGSDSLSFSVSQLLEELSEQPMADIPPLYESIDLDHAESVLVDPRGRPREDVSIQFTHAGYEITIDSVGEISATPRSAVNEGLAAD